MAGASGNHLHDRFFRRFLLYTGVLRDFFVKVFPASKRSALDLSALRICDSEVEGIRYPRSHLDLVVECGLPDEAKRRILVLLEHKSWRDPRRLLPDSGVHDGPLEAGPEAGLPSHAGPSGHFLSWQDVLGGRSGAFTSYADSRRPSVPPSGVDFSPVFFDRARPGSGRHEIFPGRTCDRSRGWILLSIW